MNENTSAILARFSPSEWARSKALGFPIPLQVQDKIRLAALGLKESEALRMAQARRRRWKAA